LITFCSADKVANATSANEATDIIANATTELWLEDFAEVIELSVSTQKPILINFTGSDWCYWCVKLEEEIFSTSVFEDFARKNLVLYKADFPRQIEQTDALIAQNRVLREKYNSHIRGLPTILLVNANEEVIATTGYLEGGPVAYVEHIQKLLSK
jgi:protein disulfide-isomerase